METGHITHMDTKYEDPRRSQAPEYIETTAAEDRESEAHYKSLERACKLNPEGRGLTLMGYD